MASGGHTHTQTHTHALKVISNARNQVRAMQPASAWFKNLWLYYNNYEPIAIYKKGLPQTPNLQFKNFNGSLLMCNSYGLEICR